MPTQRIRLYLLAAIVVATGIYSCKNYIYHTFRSTNNDLRELPTPDPTGDLYYKLHFKDGGVSVLYDWQLNPTFDTIRAFGRHYDYNRTLVAQGMEIFSADEIAIIETNDLSAVKSKDKGRIVGMIILTGINVAMTALCITNPKACFGSCPTFYADGETQSVHYADAEGFSSSVAPSMEKRDVDALRVQAEAGPVWLTMKNEALETHLVDQVAVAAVPKPRNGYIYQDQREQYYSCTKAIPPARAQVDGHPIAHELAEIDELEYYSVTDSTDLTAKEEILLTFDNVPDDRLGLVLNFRQSLLTTFLFYSGLSYMGDQAGEYFAQMETSDLIRGVAGAPFEVLGGLEVYVKTTSTRRWRVVEEVVEMGPIARNLLLVPFPKGLPNNKGRVQVKIRLTKGLWRLDYAALTSILERVEPIVLSPAAMEVINGHQDSFDNLGRADDDYFTSLPGDEYRLRFDLPKDPKSKEYELFLVSEGYYLEWIRQQWSEQKDIAKLRKMYLLDPATWRDLAIEFKSMEEEVESVFWSSKYAAPLQ